METLARYYSEIAQSLVTPLIGDSSKMPQRGIGYKAQGCAEGATLGTVPPLRSNPVRVVAQSHT